ncbi:MAG: methyltransferase domain-containing protein [bacterium]|nr:methyltransferase domain-containing protein [bacterium]MDT8365278.1 methyltransferase domain-containing protein [bacterium]
MKQYAWYYSLRSALKGSPTRTRFQSNRWLRIHCRDIAGDVLSIGAGHDSDRQGGVYRDYFPDAASYTTSEVSDEFGSDLVLDVRSMPQIEDATYDCVYCSGVLEHVDDYRSGLAEMTRILKPGGIFLLGLPFRQAPHLAPHDYWRFTEYGIRYLLGDSFDILDLTAVDVDRSGMPATYWVKSRKKR